MACCGAVAPTALEQYLDHPGNGFQLLWAESVHIPDEPIGI